MIFDMQCHLIQPLGIPTQEDCAELLTKLASYNIVPSTTEDVINTALVMRVLPQRFNNLEGISYENGQWIQYLDIEQPFLIKDGAKPIFEIKNLQDLKIWMGDNPIEYFDGFSNIVKNWFENGKYLDIF